MEACTYLVAENNITQDEVDEQEWEEERVDDGVYEPKQSEQQDHRERAVVRERIDISKEWCALLNRMPLKKVEDEGTSLQNFKWQAGPTSCHDVCDEKIGLRTFIVTQNKIFCNTIFCRRKYSQTHKQMERPAGFRCEKPRVQVKTLTLNLQPILQLQ